jgi:hypothetical protein
MEDQEKERAVIAPCVARRWKVVLFERQALQTVSFSKQLAGPHWKGTRQQCVRTSELVSVFDLAYPESLPSY